MCSQGPQEITSILISYHEDLIWGHSPTWNCSPRWTISHCISSEAHYNVKVPISFLYVLLYVDLVYSEGACALSHFENIPTPTSCSKPHFQIPFPVWTRSSSEEVHCHSTTQENLHAMMKTFCICTVTQTATTDIRYWAVKCGWSDQRDLEFDWILINGNLNEHMWLMANMGKPRFKTTLLKLE